jgi:hypothetical protein
MIQNNTTNKEGFVIRDQTLPHFLTATVVDWIDIFTRKTYRDTVIECLDYCIEHNFASKVFSISFILKSSIIF